jgi:hypothetical protein
VLLEAAFDGAKRYTYGSEKFSDSTHAYTFTDPNRPRTTISFKDDARVDFDKAARSLARHALREDGLSPDQLRLLIAQACWREPTIGREAALAMVAEGVARPRRQFKVTFMSRDLVRHDEFAVGSVTFTKTLPEHLREWDQGTAHSSSASNRHARPPRLREVIKRRRESWQLSAWTRPALSWRWRTADPCLDPSPRTSSVARQRARAVTTSMHPGQAQLDQRPHRNIGTQHGIGQLEQRVRPRGQTAVELDPKPNEIIKRRGGLASTLPVRHTGLRGHRLSILRTFLVGTQRSSGDGRATVTATRRTRSTSAVTNNDGG